MRTLIVTGGAGFIGSNLVRALATRRDVHVVVLDSMTYAVNPRTVEELRALDYVTVVEGDIADRPLVADLLARHQPWAIVNLAAETHVDRSVDSPAAFIHTNINGTFTLLEAARRYTSSLGEEERRRFRFLHISTDEVFGSLGPSGTFSESSTYAPNSPYSASKAAADHLVRAYHRTYGLPTLVTNCSNNYGPFQHPEKLIPLMLLNALEGRPLPIYGTGNNVRDWLHVDDHCQALLAVLGDGRPGESYTIGAGNEQTNLAVVNMLCEVLEDVRPARDNAALLATGKTSYLMLREFVMDRPGHDHRYAVDATKITSTLGWQPTRDFRQGLLETVRWYIARQDWCAASRANYDRQRLGLTHAAK